MLLMLETFKCCSETGTCEDIKIELEIEIHQTNESIDQAELRIKQVEIASNKKLGQLQNLKSKV